MINEEIDTLLSNIEKELFELVKFVNDVEKAYNEKFPDLTTDTSPESDSGQSTDSEAVVNTALSEAFNIVENVLLRICLLLEEYSSLKVPKCARLRNAHLARYYQLQYIYQIAYFLVKTIEENLHRFSEKLNQIIDNGRTQERDLPSRSCAEKPKQKRYFVDEKFFKERSSSKMKRPKLSRNHVCKCEYEPSPNSRSIDADYESPSSSIHKSYSQVKPFKEYLGHVSGMHNVDVTKTLTRLISTLEDLVLYIGTEPQSRLKTKSFTSSNQDWDVLGYCCPTSCVNCCSKCKILHSKVKTKEDGIYEENISNYPVGMFPMPAHDPTWSKMGAQVQTYRDARDCKQNDKKMLHSYKKKHKRKRKVSVLSHYSRHKRTSLPTSGTQSSSRTSSSVNKAETLPSVTDRLYGSLPGPYVVKNTETPDLHPKKTHPKPEKGPRPCETCELYKSLKSDSKEECRSKRAEEEKAPKEYLEVELPLKMKDELKVQTESGPKPLWAKTLENVVYYKGKDDDKLGGFCLIPVYRERKNKTQGCSQNISSDAPPQQEKDKMQFRFQFNSSHTPLQHNDKKDANLQDGIQLDKEQNSQRRFPDRITLDVLKFSNLVKARCKKLFSEDSETSEQQDPNTILDMLLDSATECVKTDEEVKPKEGVDKQTNPKSPLQKPTTADFAGEVNESDLENFVDSVVNVAQQINAASHRPTAKTSIKIQENKKDEIPKKGFARACKACRDSIFVSSSKKSQEHAYGKTEEECRRVPCSQCRNGHHRGLTIHQCHRSLPPNVLEVRHLDEEDKICVCFFFWDKTREPEDWRWRKNPYYDPTRVEVEQKATLERDPIIKVIYGPEETMVRESLAETQLKIVREFTQDLPTEESGSINSLSREVTKSVSRTYLEMKRKSKRMPTPPAERRQRQWSVRRESFPIYPGDRNIVTKLGRFFDDIQKSGYGRGPPLVIKIGRKTALKDAYNILMASSNIKLNYYHSLRVLFTDEKRITTSTNFMDEDQSEELFDIFARKLFMSTKEFRLFGYPSEETQCMYLNPQTPSHPQWFEFAGTILGLSFIHQKQMEIKLSLCLFKCLLDRTLSLHDLQEMDPLFYQKLVWLRDNEVTDKKPKLMFVVRDKVENKFYETALVANGHKLAVTESNKFKYIELAVKWKLAERCLYQLKGFRKGFAAVLDPFFLASFSEKELQDLIRKPADGRLFPSKSSSDEIPVELTRRGTW